MLVVCFFAYDDLTPWPGPWTTVIVAASAVLIRLAPGAPTAGRLLTFRPIVAIGLVSYATYLWHHPLLSFFRIADPNNLTPGKALLLLTASVALGAKYTMIGRAYLYGLMAGGRRGVDRTLEILRSELVRTMTLLGVASLEELGPQHVTQLERLVPRARP